MNRKPLIELLRTFAERPAINTTSASYTYAHLADEVERQLQRLSDAGVAPGATVFLQGDYSFGGIALFLAMYQNDNIIAMNTSDNAQEIDSKRATANASFFAETGGCKIEPSPAQEDVSAPLVSALREQRHAGLILFSSGTTGKPKAMLHDLDRLIDGYLGRRSRPLSMLLFLLFDHIGGINTLLNILSIGGGATLVDEKTPARVAALIERFKVSVLPTSPTFLNLLLLADVADQNALTSLRMITYGTEPMPESLLQSLREVLPRVKLLQTFGTSETGIVSTTSISSNSLFMKFNDASTEYKVVDGELWLRSTRQILGYLNHPSDSFTDDGWFRTGDLVEQGEDGSVRIRGRRKEVINVGGEKVFPAEVESVLLKHPWVRDCRAYGQANGITGQFVAADVVLDAQCGQQVDAALREIRAFARSNMDSYKAPVRLNAVGAIAYSARFKKLLGSPNRQSSTEL
ncbi:class I adenylate-forming enzyme family protein [Paraburkholderia diazotrophica]|uniref:Acyl-CoA synthetase (AMP-forming)/AMP-acid ligase II n=1 Tax=Paraburkholderia diazotrophica TaxID=667676 RepID=A0A1H7DGL8_9BURK|nr:fatty acid--CoA ligase family protein [Paraburkholderia diazotrophica]SEK00963.1 Acyl-CoA synthetase (AMP-forming)/AMP-acid ligase II [Paraburkholderia diazotrophica]